MIAGAGAAIIGTIMSFTAVKLPSSTLFVWYLVGGCLFQGYSIFYTPYSGCISLLAPEPEKKAAMAGTRLQMNSVGKIVFSFTNVVLIAALGKAVGSQAGGYTAFVVIASILLIIGVSFCVRLITGIEKPDEKNKQTGKTQTVPILTMIKLGFTKPMLLIMIGAFGKSVCYSLIGAIMAYYYRYVIGDLSGLTWYLTASTFILLLGGVVGPFVSSRLGLKWTCIVGYIFYAIALLVSFTVGKNGVLFTICMSIGIFGYSLEHGQSGALMSMAIDYTGYKSGVDAKAFLFQFAGIMAPLSTILRSAAIGYGLAYFGFNAKDVTANAIFGIRVITAFVPVFFLVIGGIAYFFFPITEKKLREAKAEFEAKKAANIQ